MMRGRELWAAVAAAGLVAGCRAEQTAEPSPAPTSSPAIPVLPVADPPMDREQLILAVGRAASAYAAGADDSAQQRTLLGRRFAVRLRFGCPGDEDGAHRFTFDAERGVLRIEVRPDLAGEDLPVSAPLPDAEAIHGFRVERPWMLTAACPAAPEPVSPPDDSPAPDDSPSPEPAPSPAEPRIGLVQVFTQDQSRAARLDESVYRITRRLAAGETPSTQGYDLVLSGRLARLTDGRTIACTGDPRIAPPRCVVSVTLDRVAVETPAGVSLAEWGTG